MSDVYSHSTTFVLNKAHFSDCYSASIANPPTLNDYFKAFVLSVFGIVLVLFSDVVPYMSWFVVGLGVVEALSVRYRKGWWVARQMLSKAANSEVTLTFDEQGIHSKSYYQQQDILWQEIKELTSTEQGWLVHFDQGKSFISHHCLPENMQTILKEFRVC